MMLTWSEEAGHEPLVMVHWKVFVPTLNPETVEVGKVGEVIVPVPATSVQSPVPAVGVLPVKVAVKVLQRFWSAPALEVVGSASTMMLTWSVEGGHEPLVMVHWNVFVPT